MGFDSQPHGKSAIELVRLARAGLTPVEAIWLVVQSGRPVAAAALEAELPELPAPEPGVPDPVPALAGRPLSGPE
jgi:hypothetical protein